MIDIRNKIEHIQKTAKVDAWGRLEVELMGVPSGLTTLDRYTQGWQNKDLIILAARPSMGKTSLALFFSKMSAMYGYPVGFFSLEMSEEQLACKLLASETNYTPTEVRQADPSRIKLDAIDDAIQKLMTAKIIIDDQAGMSISRLRTKAKLMKARYGIRLMVVDYLQLLHGSRREREQEISEISRGLKMIAKELDIPVIALSQLNREVDKRSDKRPVLSDLRESGSIEQDADMVIFVHRPEKYGIQTFENGTDTKNRTMLILAKHRNGATGEVIVEQTDDCSRYF